MHKKKLKKLLYDEGKRIDHELDAYYKTKHNLNFFKLKNRKLLPLFLSLALIISGLVYASTQIGALEWFVKESSSYLDILEDYPEYKMNLTLEEGALEIKVRGFVSDEENNYLYLELPTAYSLVDDINIINKDELYKKSIENSDFEFYYNKGMSSLTGNQQVYKFKGFDQDSGHVEFELKSLKDIEGNIHEIDISFDIPFKKTVGKTVKINQSKSLKLPHSDEELSLRVEEIKFLPTATYIMYELEHSDKINVQLGNILINNKRLSSFFFSGDENVALYHPMKAEDISSFKWTVDSYSITELSIDRLALEKLPSTFSYEGYDLTVEESLVDGYLSYTVTDTGYLERDFTNLDMRIYCGNIFIAYNDSLEAYVAEEDGSSKKIENFIDYMQADVEKIKVKSYSFKSTDTYEVLKKKDYIDFENEPIVLRINNVKRSYNVNEDLALYFNLGKVIKALFK